MPLLKRTGSIIAKRGAKWCLAARSGSFTQYKSKVPFRHFLRAVFGCFAAIAALVEFLSAVLMASEGLLVRLLSQTESALSMMLHITGFGVLLMCGPAIIEWKSVSLSMIAGCFALGPLSVIAQYCTIRGYRIAPLSVVGPVDYSWLVFAMILGSGLITRK
jgi:drug/metabolite transporter (DMT)-like permease